MRLPLSRMVITDRVRRASFKVAMMAVAFGPTTAALEHPPS